MILGVLNACMAGVAAPPAYPIPPRPLRLLVHQSQFIVTARVREAEGWRSRRTMTEEERLLGGYALVVLELEDLVKGDPGVVEIEQKLYPWACPAPARYVAGTRVLAFLDRAADDDGEFTTHALSYGAKTLDDDAMGVYLERIREQLDIERLPEDDSRFARQIEWLVRCAEHPATRWEGAYELAPAGDFMSHYEHERTPPDFAQHLSAVQIERLRSALLSASSFDAGERCLEELLQDDPDPHLQWWLVGQLRTHSPEVVKEAYGVSAFLIERIARRDDRPEVQELAASFAALKREAGAAAGEARLDVARRLLAFF
jgi:hypothetical protein